MEMDKESENLIMDKWGTVEKTVFEVAQELDKVGFNILGAYVRREIEHLSITFALLYLDAKEGEKSGKVGSTAASS
jgi:hypothetical protein